MAKGLAAAVAALTALLLIPASAPAKRVAGLEVRPGCDFIGAAVCQFPWPNDYFTKRDRRTDTGLRLALTKSAMPRNKNGKPIDPTDMNRADGFSPGSAMLVKVPGLDRPAAVRRSKLPPLTNLSKGLAKRSPVVVINARTGKRHPIWAEIDSNPKRAGDRVLIIRPARNLEEGERYIVALRNLKNARGKQIKAGRGFRIYRDRIKTGARPIEKRRQHFEQIFRALKKAGVKRGQLYLAWDFTVASERSLAGRMLHIRDDAFKTLGDTNLKDLTVAGSSPAFTVDSVTDLTPAEDDRIARKIAGTITVPCYLTKGCAPGGSFSFDSRGLPRRMGTMGARFYLQHPALGARPRLTAEGAGVALRARPARQRDPDRRVEHQVDVERAQLRVLRHRVGGLLRRGPAEHPLGAGRLLRLQHDGRPDAAGLPQHALPGTGDDPPAGPVHEPGVPEGRRRACSTRRACSSTATARAGSWEAA